MAGKTVVHDKSTGTTYIGKFAPGQIDSDGYATAHTFLATKAGVDTSQCVAGSVKGLGNGKWAFAEKSESINAANFGTCDAPPGELDAAKANLESGNYKTVSVEQGSINNGQKSYVFS
jgi:hypothetical protein